MKQSTLVIVCNKSQDKFLMGYHQRGEGKGKLNFIGGKVGDKPEFAQETAEESMRRELFEEAGLVPTTLTHCADMYYHFPENQRDRDELVRVYKVDNYIGEPKENAEEFQLVWIDKDSLPVEQMWASDQIWLPRLIESNFTFQTFTFYHDSSGTLLREGK